MLLNQPSKGEHRTVSERDLQNINLMCYIHANEKKLFAQKTVFFHLFHGIFMQAEREILFIFMLFIVWHEIRNLLSFGSATITCFDGVAGSGISESCD
jgi:hypothetical protein